jgi:hypothetical protein
MVEAGALDVLFNLGADEVEPAARSAAPSGRASAAWPTMTRGRSAALKASAKL